MTKRSNQIRAFVGPLVTSFTLARRMSVKHYCTEKACAAGHVERRLASTGQCLACLRTRQSRLYSENAKSLCEKAKSWRSKNPVKVAETNKAWRRANAAAIKQKRKAKYAENATENRSLGREYYLLHQERLREYSRLKSAENRNKTAKRRKSNPAPFAAFCAKRRATKLQATPKWFGEFDEFVIKEAHSLAKARDVMTGIKWNVDHMLPLSGKWVSGFHCGENTQVIPKTLNVRKSARNILTKRYEWVQKL